MISYLLNAGLFCHHVLAICEHLRLDKIPNRYILQRYTKDPVRNPDFDRRDYKKEAPTETTVEYRRTILYNEAMKLVGEGCSSDRMFHLALAALKEAV